MVIRALSLIFTFLFLNIQLFSQEGKLLVIGGGSESNSAETSWNYAAYNWAVDVSGNKKVAILHYSTPSSWLESFFADHCGAVQANSYIVNSSNANSAGFLETLSEYDVFFFRGGNQWEYYSDYKGTGFQELVIEKYNSGGVICGTSAGLAILSGVVFTAQNGTIYSDEAIININHPKNTLADDLFQFYPNLIFDSHFTDRGRMARLVGFMARYERDNQTTITGIGVDERTALAIDGDALATVYGMGTVQVIRKSPGNDFDNTPQISVNSLIKSSLVQGNTIDLNTMEITGLEEVSEITTHTENFTGSLFLSGGDDLSTTNIAMLEAFVNEGDKADPIIVLTGNHNNNVTNFANKLTELGAQNVDVFEAVYATVDNNDLAASIEQAKKIMLINHNSYQLSLFMAYGGNGQLLRDRITTIQPPMAFIGDNARFPAEIVVDNYLTANGVTQANLLFAEGLGVLQTSIIIPNVFKRASSGITNYWKSTNGSLTYAMMQKDTKNGIWLHEDNYIIIKKTGNEIIADVYGNTPVMVLKNPGTNKDFVTQTYNGLSHEIPQHLAGFEELLLSFIKPGESFLIAPYLDNTAINIIDNNALRVFPNPAGEIIHYDSTVNMKSYNLYSLNGQLLGSGVLGFNSGTIILPAAATKQGGLMIEFITTEQQSITRKVMVK